MAALRVTLLAALACTIMAVPLRDIDLPTDSPSDVAKRLVAAMTLDEKLSLTHGVHGAYVGNVAGVARLGVPPLLMNDGPQGFRTAKELSGTSTAFPSGLTVAATWDVDAAAAWGAAMGEEFAGKGANVQLGPGLCVARVPRNGRNFEYISGEDPHLGAALVGPVVKGIQAQGVVANAKHYMCAPLPPTSNL